MAQRDDSIGGVVGRFLSLPFRGLGYVFNPQNWLNTSEDMKRDMSAAWSEVGDGVPKVSLFVDLGDYSRQHGAYIIKFDVGWVAIGVSIFRDLRVKQSTLDQLHKDHPNIWFSIHRRKPCALIEIDVKGSSVGHIRSAIMRDVNAIHKATEIGWMIVGDTKLAENAAKLLHDSCNRLKLPPALELSYLHPGGQWADGSLDDLILVVAVKDLVLNKPR